MFEDRRSAAAVAAADVAGARLDRATALPPGPLAIGLLAGTDPATLDHAGRVELLQAWERQSRWLAAQQLAAVAAVAGPTPTGGEDFAREDVRAALAEVGGSWRADVDTARALHGPLAAARVALAGGALSYPQVRALAQETEPLDPATAAAVCQRVVGDGRTRTPADFRRRVRAAVIATDPAGAQARADAATARRQVSRRVLADAQAGLDINGPAPAVATIWATLTRRAGHAGHGDPRTLDQRRFDTLVDLCTASSPPPHPAGDPSTGVTATGVTAIGSSPRDGDANDDTASRKPVTGDSVTGNPATGSTTTGASPAGASGTAPTGTPARARRSRTGTGAEVFVFADAATWAGLADHPAELDGYGPIPAGVARDCFTDARWRAVVTDTLTGLVTAVSDTTYTPSPRTRRHLFAQDRGCLFPGCPTPVWHCDADHSLPHDQGGCTDPDNCGLLCRRHHKLKTFTRWRWRRRPDRAVEWTSPHGATYTRPPARYHADPLRADRRPTDEAGSQDARAGPDPPPEAEPAELREPVDADRPAGDDVPPF